MLNDLVSGIISGILISLGGGVFLSCENKIAGSVFFAVALLCICMLGYYLYTGKICFMIEKHDKAAWQLLILCIIGNATGTFVCGRLLAYGVPNMQAVAATICAAKLNQLPLQTIIRGTFCGILIYLAVIIFRQNRNISGIVFCIPVFILSGYEHSIADMFYFAAAGSFDAQSFIFILLVILGNSIGGLLLPFLNLALKEN